MKLGDFVLDSATNVYINGTEAAQIHYLDGSESYLKEVLQSTNDLGLLSTELKIRIKDWPSLYHLSPYRATILDCFDFQNKQAKVLELGAGCGAVTRWLGEHFQNVYAVEGSFQRAGIARLRCRDLSSVKVYAINFFALDLEKQFDIVTLIGVLEYSHLYHPELKQNPHKAALSALQLIHGAMKDQGILLLAIENKLGLKYFSGAKEDHSGKQFDGIQGYPDAKTPVTFSSAELEILLKSAGFTSVDFYLPFPDYKLAKTIINAQSLSTQHYYLYNWIETPFPDRAANQRTLLFNESLALREISKAGLLKDLANSFLIVAHKGEKDDNFNNLGFSDKEWTVKHYSLNRHWLFCKRVTLCTSASGSLEVKNSSAFHTNQTENLSRAVFTHSLTTKKYYSGDLLLFSIFEISAAGNFSHLFQPLLDKLNNFLMSRFSTGTCDSTGMPLLSGESLDVTFWNIVVAENSGEWIPVDPEWTFSSLLPVDFIIWRNLYHLFSRYRAYLDKDTFSAAKSLNELTYEWLKKIYPEFKEERFTLAMQFDQSFQNFVNHGLSDKETLLTIEKLYQQPDTFENAPQQTEEKKKPRVSIIIPIFNKVEYTRKCLDALFQNTPVQLYEIIIVDNASTDGTQDFLKRLKGNIRIIVNDKNLGFAKACNQGARVAASDYILFLNNDTEPKCCWLEPLLNVLDGDKSVAAVGSKLLFPDMTIQHAGLIILDDRKLPDPLVARHIFYRKPENFSEANQLTTYQALTAACLMIRKSAFQEAGTFDEGFWNGYEDVDLCFKLQENGWKLVFQPASVVIHHESKSGSERFSKVSENISRLHEKWLGKIKPDLIITKDGLVKQTDAGRIQPYAFSLSNDSILPPISTDMLTSIIILTHNQLEHTKKCLASIEKYTPELHEIIVVDNASTDGTLEFLRTEMAGSNNIRVIANKINRGFAAGSNQGISLARGEYILLLNNDTIVTPGWLVRMTDVFKRYPKTGVAGPMSNNVTRPQLVENVGYKKNKDIDEFARKWAKKHEGQSFTTFKASGFCLLAKRGVIDAIGGLDEQFGSGNFEDDDFCSRAFLSGFEIRIVQDVFIHHTGRQTFKGAGIDYRANMARNWELYKAKWGIPKDTPLESYWIPSHLPESVNPYVPLPDVSSDHTVDPENRWWEETGKKAEVEVKVEEKERANGLTSIIVLLSDRKEYAMKCVESIQHHTKELHEIIFVPAASSYALPEWLQKLLKEQRNCRLVIPPNPPLEKGGSTFVPPFVMGETDTGNDVSYEGMKKISPTLEKGGKGGFSDKKNNHLSYAQACNVGISESSGEYIVILRDNTVVTEDWLSGMIECLNISPDTGIVGPMTVNIEGPQNLLHVDSTLIENNNESSIGKVIPPNPPLEKGGKGGFSDEYIDQFAKTFRERNRYRRVQVKNLNTFCLLFRHNVAEKIGLFDESLDTDEYAGDDYCLRAAVENYRNLIAGDVVIYYDGRCALPALHDRIIFGKKWSDVDGTKPRSKKIYCANALFIADELNQKGQREKAVVTLIDGIKLHPDEKRLYYALAEVFIEDKKYTEARKVLESMPEGFKKDTGWLELMGNCAVCAGMNEEAGRYTDEVLLLNSASAKGWNLKGTVSFQKGSYADAERFFQKAIEFDGSLGEAYANIGALRWASGNKEEALKLFERAFILSPTAEDIVTNYYTAVVELSKLPEAEKAFQEAIALHPFNRKLKFILIDNLLQQGKYQEAMKAMEEAMVAFGIDDNTLALALRLRDTIGPVEVNKDLQTGISVCMIVKNEENNIANAIQSIKPIADEIIIVDTGSSDRTNKIAKVFGAKVFDFTWTDNFSAARNFSLSKASGRWILVLDADEMIASSDLNSLQKLIRKGGSNPVAYDFITRNYVVPVNTVGWVANDGKYPEQEVGSGWFPSNKVRLFPNNKRIIFEKPIHELVESSVMKIGIKITKCDIPIHHYGKLNREKISDKGKAYLDINARKLTEQEWKNIDSVTQLAIQASELGLHEKALEYWDKVIALGPDLPKAHYGKGNNYFHLGRYEDARNSLKKAIDLAPDLRDAILLFSSCEIYAGRAENAIFYLKKLLVKDPSFTMAMVNLAMACFCAGLKEKGLEYIEKLKDMNINCTQLFHNCAQMAMSANNYQYAIYLLQAATETGNVTNETATFLAECYKKTQLNQPK